jgi:hypothetical protein
MFDIDDQNTVVTTFVKTETWNYSTNDWEESVWTTYSVFRFGVYVDHTLDVKEDDFFANPSGYLAPHTIYVDPFMFSSGSKGKGGALMAGVKASKFGQLRYASKAGIAAYNKLKGTIKGTQVHHLIEQRFSKLFPELGNPNTWSSIVLTKAEHIKFTTLWRMEIGLSKWQRPLTTLNASRRDVIEAAKRIYKDYPEILQVIPKK